MKIETDISRIKELAAQQEGENWRFRSFLKGCRLSLEELDNLVHWHYRYVASQIDCCSCGNCCQTVSPVLSDNDVENLARELNISAEEVNDRYLRPGEEPGTVTFSTTPCPFLLENKCTVYAGRPDDCQSYPHIQKDEFALRLFSVITNCAICPIVFNVFECLKSDIWLD